MVVSAGPGAGAGVQSGPGWAVLAQKQPQILRLSPEAGAWPQCPPPPLCTISAPGRGGELFVNTLL